MQNRPLRNMVSLRDTSQYLWTCWGGSLSPLLIWVGGSGFGELCLCMKKKRQKVLENPTSSLENGGKWQLTSWNQLPRPAWLSGGKQIYTIADLLLPGTRGGL